jgi:hypothetical protein
VLFCFCSLCGCGANKLHTTLVALGLVAFLVWAVFGLLFECGERDCATQSTLLLCWVCGCECGCMLTNLFSASFRVSC